MWWRCACPWRVRVCYFFGGGGDGRGHGRCARARARDPVGRCACFHFSTRCRCRAATLLPFASLEEGRDLQTKSKACHAKLALSLALSLGTHAPTKSI